jgi:hypothetical protein
MNVVRMGGFIGAAIGRYFKTAAGICHLDSSGHFAPAISSQSKYKQYNGVSFDTSFRAWVGLTGVGAPSYN